MYGYLLMEENGKDLVVWQKGWSDVLFMLKFVNSYYLITTINGVIQYLYFVYCSYIFLINN